MIKLRRLILAGLLFVTGLAHADWATDRSGSAGYVTVTTLASVIDEAVPFCVVYLSDLPSGFHSAMDAASDTDGKTIRVSTSDGSTQLPCVPLGVNTGTDTGCLIFLDTGSSASVDVAFRIYVGNAALTMPSASGGMGEQAVFAAYDQVYFPGMDVRDFTAGGRTLTAVNTPGTAASGYEGITAASYTASSTQYHKYEGTQSVSTWPLSYETLAYSTSAANTQSIMSLSKSTSNDDYGFLYFNGPTGGDPFSADLKGPSGSTSSASTSTGYSASTWYSVAMTRSGTTTGTTTVYKDGGSSGTSGTTLVATAFDRFSIGAVMLNAGVFSKLDGCVAVALLSGSVRSGNFLATMKQNWDGALYSVGSWTSNSIAPGTTGWVLFQTASQTTTADADWASTGNALVDDANATTSSVPDSGYSETLKLTNPAYGTSIPTGAIYTVSFRIKHKGTGGGGRRALDSVVQFIDDTGTQVGDNVAKTTNYWPSTTASEDYVATGLSLDGTEFTSAAGVAIKASGVDQTGTETASIYAVWIKVDWTCPSALDTTRGFFALTE